MALPLQRGRDCMVATQKPEEQKTLTSKPPWVMVRVGGRQGRATWKGELVVDKAEPVL